jgi:hypothetical protein
MKEAEKESKNKSNRKLFIVILFILLTVILIGIASFLLYQNNQLPFLNKSSNAGTQVDDTLIKVGKLIKLPNETPEIATITDIEKLRNQSVFKNAQNGDRVLIFTEAKRAIVYRPSENIIIDVGNISLSKAASQPAELDPQAAQEEVRVVVFNATGWKGYAGRIGNELKSKFPNLQIADTANAAGDYENTIVIDLTGKNSSFVKTLAQELSGKVDELPKGEEKPDSDILIILGK